MKPFFYLVSSLMPRPDEAPDLRERALQQLVELAAPYMADLEGEKLRETGDRVLLRFSGAVDAVLCAVRIQQAHHRREQGPHLPPVRIVVFGDEFDGPPEEALLWSSAWLAATGAGEIQVSESVAAIWRELGNRELSPAARNAARLPFSVHRVNWRGPSREPRRTIRRRGWLTVGLVVVPSLVLLASSWMQPDGPRLPPDTDVLLAGPFWTASGGFICPGLQFPKVHVRWDPNYLHFSPVPWQGRFVRRLTGVLTPQGLRADLVDERTGRMEARLVLPCTGDPCACLAQMPWPVQPDLPEEALREACTGLAAAEGREGLADVCLQEHKGILPAKDKTP